MPNIFIRNKYIEWNWSTKYELHTIGEYDVVQCKMNNDDDYSFHPFVNGKCCGLYGRTLDEAIVLAINYKNHPTDPSLAHAATILITGDYK